MGPTDHVIEVEVPEVEVCIDTSTEWDPDAEAYARPSDEVVKRAVDDLIKRHYEELVDLCAVRYVQACEDMRAVMLDECSGTINPHERRVCG